MSSLFSFVADTFYAVGTFFSTLALSVGLFFGYTEPPVVIIATSTPSTIIIATSTPPTTLPIATPKPVPVKPPVVVPPTPKPPPVVVPPTPPVIVPPVVVPPVTGTIGTTTLAVQSIPLLSGGVVPAGKTVPVSYLQITNTGTAGALIKGFRLRQTGSAPGEAVIALSTVDDRGGSRGLVGGTEGATPFKNEVAFAPTDAYFAPGQMRLFTIKAMLSQQVSAEYLGMQLVLVVTGVESTAAVQGSFPIPGTTWTIAP